MKQKKENDFTAAVIFFFFFEEEDVVVEETFKTYFSFQTALYRRIGYEGGIFFLGRGNVDF